MTILAGKAIRSSMTTAFSIYPGAIGGGAGSLVNGIDNALSKGLGDVGRGGGNPLGLLAALGGLANGALQGLNRFGNRFKLYRDFKENCVKKPYNAIKGKLASMLGMTDDAAKGVVNSVDDAVKGGSQVASRATTQAVTASTLVDQFGKPFNTAGAIDDVARGAGGVADDLGRAAGGLADDAAKGGVRAFTRAGAKFIPFVGVAIDGAFRVGDYKTAENAYSNATEQHKAGKITDEQMADASHARGSAHSRNGAGMATGLISAVLTAGAVGACFGAPVGGVGAIPGFLVAAGAGAIAYFIGDKVGSSVSDAAWGNPPSYSKSAEVLSRNEAENGVAKKGHSRDASEAWAAARDNSSYAHSGDIRTPGIVSDPALVSRFSNNLAGAGSVAGAVAVQQDQKHSQARALARGKTQAADLRQRDRQNTVG